MTDSHGSRREHRLRTPTSELPHEEKIKRQQGHMRILTGALLLVLAMLVYSAFFDLDNWSEWIVFGVICATAIGATIAIHTRG